MHLIKKLLSDGFQKQRASFIKDEELLKSSFFWAKKSVKSKTYCIL